MVVLLASQTSTRTIRGGKLIPFVQATDGSIPQDVLAFLATALDADVQGPSSWGTGEPRWTLSFFIETDSDIGLVGSHHGFTWSGEGRPTLEQAIRAVAMPYRG